MVTGGYPIMKKCFAVSLLAAALLLIACDNRNGPVSPRNNEYDSGGTNFLYDGIPVIYGISDSVWTDFDHESGLGILKVYYRVDDPNVPHDTLSVRFFSGGRIIAETEHFTTSDTFLTLEDIAPATSILCSLQVTDRFDSTVTFPLLLKSPVLLPPLPPSPSLTIVNDSALITWNRIASATSYHVYVADSVQGPFSLASEIEQSGNKNNSYSYKLPKYGATFFIVSSLNAGGENRSEDTLVARKMDTTLVIPSISSVSKGTFEDHIVIEAHLQADAPAGFDLYRAESVNGHYELIAQIANPHGGLDFYHSDTVKDNRVYYYKLASVSVRGATSELSAPDSGYISMKVAILDLSVKSIGTSIELNWTAVANAAKYNVYRSSVSCKNQLQKISVTSDLNYFDPVKSSITYFYSVTAYSSNNTLLAESDCHSASLGPLPQVSGIKITNTPQYSLISWDSLPGACSYIIYRSLSQCPSSTEVLTTTTQKSFKDTSNIGTTRYYKIAGVDDANRTGELSGCYIGSTTLLPPPVGFVVSTGTQSGSISLSWTPLTGAKSYAIYRSSESCVDLDNVNPEMKITTVSRAEYTDIVPNTSTYYYRVRGIDANGTEGSPSECRSGRVQVLPKPEGVQASYNQYMGAVKITWKSVPNADGYYVYRGVSSTFAGMTQVKSTSSTEVFDSVPGSRIYYYRVVAYNKQGPGDVSDFSSGRSLLPALLYASNNTDGSINLSWSFTQTYYRTYIYMSSDSNSFEFVDSVSNSSSTTVNPPGYIKYFFHVKLRLTENDMLIQSNTVSAYKRLPPPANLNGYESLDGVYLYWDNVSGADSYVIYRDNISTAYATTTRTYFSDTLNDRKRHTYYVTAKNDGGESAYSSGYEAGALITPNPPTIRATGSTRIITIEFTPSPSGSTPTGYYLYRRSTYDGNPVLIAEWYSTVYYDSVPDFGTYYYSATAFNSSGTSSFSSLYSASRTYPQPPALSVTNGDYSNGIYLGWTYVYDVDAYNIYRRDPSSNDLVKIATTNTTYYFDTTMGDDYSTYTYCVTSVVDTFESSKSRLVSGRIFGPPTSIGVSGYYYGISVSWVSVNNASQYYIYRSATEDGDFVLIDSSTSATYLDTNDLSTNNFYKIAAQSSMDASVSARSKASTGITRKYPNAPSGVVATAGTDSATVKITWYVTSGATSYSIFRSTSESFDENVVTVGTSDTILFNDSVPSDSVYYYKVKAVNRGGESSLSSSTGRGYRIPKKVPVTPVDFDTLPYSGSVYLQWSMPVQTIAYTGFKIYRSDSEDGDFTLVTTISSWGLLNYLDKPPSSFPTVYWYKIASFNAKGESALSDAIPGVRR